MGAVTLVHDCEVERRGDGSAPADPGGDFRDQYIQSIDANRAYDATQFNAGMLGTGQKGGAYYIRALLWFDLNYFLPAGATITNAVWHVYLWANSTSGLHTFQLDRITQTGWLEGYATWNKYDGTNTWATPGGDFSTPSVALGAISGAGWKSYNLLGMVNDAWTTRAGICTFLMRRTDADPNDGEIMIHAKNYRPYGADKVHHLRVTYTLSGRTFEAIVT